MKKQKLTTEEKKENRKISWQWTRCIARMKAKGALVEGSLKKGSLALIIIVLVASCRPANNIHSNYHCMGSCGDHHRSGPRR